MDTEVKQIASSKLYWTLDTETIHSLTDISLNFHDSNLQQLLDRELPNPKSKQRMSSNDRAFHKLRNIGFSTYRELVANSPLELRSKIHDCHLGNRIADESLLRLMDHLSEFGLFLGMLKKE